MEHPSIASFVPWILACAVGSGAALTAQSSFGSGCVDGLGNTPVIGYPTSSWIRTPSSGERIALRAATPGLPSVLFLGAEPVDRLAVDLSVIGGDGCTLYVNPFAQLPAVVAPDGTAEVAMGPVPLGFEFLFQWVLLDGTAPRPLGIVTSDALLAAVPTQPSAFRLTSWALREPHVTLSVLFGCSDITDNAVLGIIPGLNPSIQAQIDGDGDGDLLLDLNLMLLLRPLDQGGSGGLFEFVTGSCTAPALGTVCTLPGTVPLARATYTNGPAACIAPAAGSTRPYTPPVASPVGPCFTTGSASFAFDFGGIPIALEDVSFGAEYVGNPATSLRNGLLKGFLPQTSADAILLPAALPLIGGNPLSSLFPGGTGNCSGHDDRDVGPDGVTVGWWFYFNFAAEIVALAP